MKAISLTQLQYVSELARTGHFAKAAKLCFVTQPTLSMQIQKLEEELGVVLFDRSKKPVEPTAIGHKIVALARQVLAGVAQMEETIKGEKGEVKGPFSLGIIPTLAPYLLPRFLGKFMESFPDVELSVEELQTGDILRRLRENRLDLGIAALPLHSPGTLETPLFSEPFFAYVSEPHELNRHKTLSEKSLSQQGLWLLTEGHCLRGQVLSLCQKRSGREDSKLHFESGNLETLKRLVEKSSGYTLLPWLATLDLSLKDRERFLRPFSEPVPVRQVGFVTSDGFVKFGVLEALRKVIEGSLPKGLESKGKTKTLPVA